MCLLLGVFRITKSIYIRVRFFKNTLQVRQNSDGVIRLVRSNQIGDTGYGLWSTEFNRLTGSPDDPRCFPFCTWGIKVQVTHPQKAFRLYVQQKNIQKVPSASPDVPFSALCWSLALAFQWFRSTMNQGCWQEVSELLVSRLLMKSWLFVRWFLMRSDLWFFPDFISRDIESHKLWMAISNGTSTKTWQILSRGFQLK